MAAGINIPTYTKKDFPILFASMLPMSCLVNYYLFGSDYFNSGTNFLWGTLVTFILMGSAFLTYGFVAISLKNRFPLDSQSYKRLAFCIIIFFLMSAVYMSLFLLAYDHFNFLGYEYSEADFIQAYISLMVLNIFLTFLNEGVYRYEKFRAIVLETEQLKKEYVQSQLLGLKSQMNPHFLFNSLNTLSCLIQEEPETAETFLDHMSKVYRYLLRNNEEQLVTLDTEIRFLNSYYYLLQARYGNALSVNIDVESEHRDMMMPPLTMQMIIENILNHNSFSRSKPLHIHVHSMGNELEFIHNVQPKINGCQEDCSGLANISNKYRLLCQKDISITETGKERSIQMPLIINKEPIEA